MGRSPAFSASQMLGRAIALAADGGPSVVTMKGVAAAIGAPSGSVYHRFDSRPHLLAEVWRHALTEFQRDWWRRVSEARDPGEVAVVTVRWARRNRSLARVLLLHSAEDFVGPDSPASVRDAIGDLQRETLNGLRVLAGRFLGRADPSALERATFAFASVPLAAIRRPLRTGAPITRRAENLVREAATCLMRGDDDDRRQ